MSESTQTRGACAYCETEFTRGGMSRHLRGCANRKALLAEVERGQGETISLLHLQVQPSWGDDYWLHLEMNGTATLKQLDSYLRAIWLECCGHQSRFSSGGWRGNEIGMAKKAAQAFTASPELTHIYDFGTESVTIIRAVGIREGKPTTKRPLALMARNKAPFVACQQCGEAASRLCLECVHEDELGGTLCQMHAEVHPHDEYGEPLSIVNSPRVGMCGYEGPAEPPY